MHRYYAGNHNDTSNNLYCSRRSLFILELESCPACSTDAVYFKYSLSQKTYDTSVYDIGYTSNRITKDDCQYFANAVINACRPIDHLIYADICMIAIVFITAAACFIALLVTTSKNYPKDAKEISRDNLIGGLIIGVGGFIVVLGLFLFQINLISLIFTNRQLAASAAIKYLNNNRFEGREVILSRSYHGAYIAIQFNWMQVTPAMETLHARNQDLYNYEPEIMPESNEKNDVNVGIGPLAAPQA